MNIDWSWTFHGPPQDYTHTMGAIVKILEGESDSAAFESLLRKLRNLDAANEFGYTLLHYAAQIESLAPGGIPWTWSYHEKYVLRKRERYIPPDPASAAEEEAHGVIRDGGTLVKLLLEAGVNVNCQTRCGYTPLHYAARYDNEEIAAILLNYGADPDIRILTDRFAGSRPVDLARMYSAGHVLSMLQTISSEESAQPDVRLLRQVLNTLGKQDRKLPERCLRCHEPVLYVVCYATDGGYDAESWKYVLCENCGATFTDDYAHGLSFYAPGDPENSRSLYLNQFHEAARLLDA